MLPTMNAAQMAKMMNQMGIKTTQVDAKRVIIEKSDGSKTIVEPASVTAIDMQGRQNFQVSGTIREERGEAAAPRAETVSQGEQSDAQLVAEQAHVPLERAKAALAECNGDIAGAIMKLQGGE